MENIDLEPTGQSYFNSQKSEYDRIVENGKRLYGNDNNITMCINVECERRNECFRFTKIPSEHQYSALYGKMNGENGCNYFYEPKINNQSLDEKIKV